MNAATQTLVLLFIGVVVLVLILKPGQGNREPLPTATIYSASDTAGGYCIPPDATLRTYDPSPAEMMCLAGPVHVESRAINGLKLSELLAGGPVALGVPGIGQTGCTVAPLAEQLLTDQSRIIVLGAGMVDCFFTDCSLDDYMTMVKGAVAEIKSHGKTPVIRGYHRFIETPLMSPAVLARREQFNAALQLYCHDAGIEFLDCASVPFNGAADLAPDLLHPSAAYHQRLAEFIAGRLKQIARV